MMVVVAMTMIYVIMKRMMTVVAMMMILYLPS